MKNLYPITKDNFYPGSQIVFGNPYLEYDITVRYTLPNSVWEREEGGTFYGIIVLEFISPVLR